MRWRTHKAIAREAGLKERGPTQPKWNHRPGQVSGEDREGEDWKEGTGLHENRSDEPSQSKRRRSYKVHLKG